MYCIGEVSVGFYFPYDSIIRCTGFKVSKRCYYIKIILCMYYFCLKFDYSLFDKFTDPGKDQSSNGKFPLMKPNYESVLVPDMYFSKLSHL